MAKSSSFTVPQLFEALEGKRPKPTDLTAMEFATIVQKLAQARNQTALARRNTERDGLTKDDSKRLVELILREIQTRWGDDEANFRGFAEWLEATVRIEFPAVAV